MHWGGWVIIFQIVSIYRITNFMDRLSYIRNLAFLYFEGENSEGCRKCFV